MMIPQKVDTELLEIIEKINKGADVSYFKRKHSGWLYAISPMELAAAEDELVRRGTEISVIGKNIGEHIKLLLKPSREVYGALPSNHILKSLQAEHRQVGYLLSKVEGLSKRLEKIPYLTSLSPEFKDIVHITSHTVAASKHVDIEEEYIFPAIEQKGIEAVPRLLRTEHFEMRHHGEQLQELAFNCCITEPAETARIFKEISDRIIPMKQRHMLIEEELIYPIALEVVDEEDWEALRERCETVGFCCF